MEMKSGMICSPTLLVNVCPSLMSFWRNPSARWPNTSWKNTADGAAGQQRRPGIRIHERRFIERLRFLNHFLDAGHHGLFVRRILGIEPVEIRVAVDVHAVGRFALHVQFEPVMNLAEYKLRAFGIHLVLIRGQRRKCGDRIQHRRRFAELRRIFPHAIFPGLSVHVNFHRSADGSVRLLARKIRRGAFRVCTCTCWLVLTLISASRAARYCSSVSRQISRRSTGISSSSEAVVPGLVAARRAVAEAVRVVQLIASRARLDFEPARAIFGAR